eukprot:CAMPEP_0179943152 /NCGR_PEP_ID=MMETSP0983-20121128/18116_1 /TAXON_ID=483367 /ORGANISM="non described non described, Strain CCMP 2436" /LENGTH=89 /DNA_ID=CAMNT_0021850739 /DNA_START=526 /DNA_END=791 /DNA_ORIENTATION=+
MIWLATPESSVMLSLRGAGCSALKFLIMACGLSPRAMAVQVVEQPILVQDLADEQPVAEVGLEAAHGPREPQLLVAPRAEQLHLALVPA